MISSELSLNVALQLEIMPARETQKKF